MGFGGLMENNEVKECEYQNICINFNDNLYGKCPIYDFYGFGKRCCYSILYEQLLQLKAENEQLTQKLEKAKELCKEDWEDMTVYKFQQQALKELE